MCIVYCMSTPTIINYGHIKIYDTVCASFLICQCQLLVCMYVYKYCIIVSVCVLYISNVLRNKVSIDPIDNGHLQSIIIIVLSIIITCFNITMLNYDLYYKKLNFKLYSERTWLKYIISAQRSKYNSAWAL